MSYNSKGDGGLSCHIGRPVTGSCNQQKAIWQLQEKGLIHGIFNIFFLISESLLS